MNRNTKHIILTILFGSASCLILGMLAYGFNIFNYRDQRSVIPLFALCGSILFSINKYLKKREQILTVILLVVGLILYQGKTIYPLIYVRNISFLIPLYLSILFYKYFIKKYDRFPLFLRGSSLVVSFPLLYILTLLFWIFIYAGFDKPYIYAALFHSLRYSIIIGSGLAIGFDLYEKYKEKINAFV